MACDHGCKKHFDDAAKCGNGCGNCGNDGCSSCGKKKDKKKGHGCGNCKHKHDPNKPN